MTERRSKLNCWEFKQCGRQPGGVNEQGMGRCPAATEVRLDDVHEGVNAGRACWIIAGTLCKGKVQGTFAQKFSNCQECDFYKHVKSEEGARFELSASLLRKLR